MDAEAADFDAVSPADVLDARRLPCDSHQGLAGEAFVVEVADVARGERLGERDADRVMDPLEPRGDMRDKRHLCTQLRRYLPFMDVICQAVRDDVVGEVFNVVLGARFRAGAAVARDAEDGGLAGEMGDERRNADLGGGGIAAGVCNTGGASDGATGDQFGKAVGPIGREAVIGGEVDDDGVLVADGINGFDKRLADACKCNEDTLFWEGN